MNDNGFADLFLKITGVIYLILMGNALLALFTAPVWLLAFLTPLQQSWLAVAIVAPLIAPAVGAAFMTFETFVTDGSTAVVRTFVKGWAALARKALPLGAAGSGLAVVVGVDLYALSGTGLGGVATPVFLVAAVLGLVAITTGLALIAVRRDTGRWEALKLGLVLGVRGGLWSLVSLVVIALFGWMLLQHPALALVLAPAPVLFVVWFNARRALRPCLEQDGAATVGGTQEAPCAI